MNRLCICYAVGVAVNRIAEMRRAEGLTQKQLANRLAKYLQRPAVDQTTISAYERGRSEIPDAVKLALSKALRCPIPWLMNWPEAPKDELAVRREMKP